MVRMRRNYEKENNVYSVNSIPCLLARNQNYNKKKKELRSSQIAYIQIGVKEQYRSIT